MIDYLSTALKDAGGILPVAVRFPESRVTIQGNLAAVDEAGFILINQKKDAVAYPWSAIIFLHVIGER